MNSDQAKQIHLPTLMSKLGFEPISIKKDGNEYWYRSPFRSEKDASFHTSYLGGKWIWNDFGDIGGTVIDFVMRYKGLNSVREALSYLERVKPTERLKNASASKIAPSKSKEAHTLFSFQQQSPPQEGNFFSGNRELEFIKAHQILNPVIHTYLEGRGISAVLADRYLREIKYRNVKSGKLFFGLGMSNESGGYEVRAATDDYKFKSALIKRDISLIKGQKEKPDTVNIFEGMLDFLSLVQMLNVSNLSGDSIIMHSLSSFQRTLTAIESMNYMRVNTFLDNNKSGKEYSQKFQQKLGEKVSNQSSLFEPYEDINDALKANAIPDFLKVKK